ncbi:uncharacterized protein C8A04DRAFT_30813 [Dichotomopilus funicola]|uniref:Fibroin-3 related protein n=1 Tax=Dichotomopilus funicola TaxID=1934379 RepID=A0AAN6UYH3_9PEZI|nr:hypothetical protein C8A04DRAFT_30813 [Dichotomopilus funicola]
MPTIDVAMRRSLGRGFLDLVVSSLQPAVQKRDVMGQITDVKTAFSSWDNCMQVNYCKWPVIAVIAVGGLIILSVVWCCGDCCGCCDPPRGSRHKYLDEPYIPPNHGYKSQEPMNAGFGGASPQSKRKSFAQFATFDFGGKKHNEDELPQMPEWDNSERKKVMLDDDDAVEMNALNKPGAGPHGHADDGASIGRAAGASTPNGARSPINRSPYGPPGGGAGADGFFAASAVGNNDPYSQGAPTYNQPGAAYNEPGQGYGMAGAAMGPGRRSPHGLNNGGYNDGHNNNGYGQDHGYSDSGAHHGYDNNFAASHQQPYDNYDNDYNSQGAQGYGMDSSPYAPDPRRSPAPQGPYGPESRRSPAPRGPYDTPYLGDQRRSPGPGAAFGGPNARRSPAPQGDAYARRGSPAPQGDAYARRGSPAPQGDGYARRGSPAPGQGGPYGSPRAPPQRQFSTDGGMRSPGGGSAGPTPLRNDAGFDFTSGYSRPPPSRSMTASPAGSMRGPAGAAPGGNGYRQGSPAPAADTAGAYPGYAPYKPA